MSWTGRGIFSLTTWAKKKKEKEKKNFLGRISDLQDSLARN